MSSQSTKPYTLIGTNGSPYSMKMRAILRYRRLPFKWVIRTTRNSSLIDHVKPALIPVLMLPEDNSTMIDSTPLAYFLEERHPDDRSIIPEDPSHAFLSHLIEDMGDEWLTKSMFHYRWMYEADIKYATQWIIDEKYPDATDEERKAHMHAFSDRQIGRMPLVGCTEENRPTVENSYHRILNILEGHVDQHRYLFGSRPSLGDFGLFGQLCTLATDPTPLAIMREEAQRTESWIRILEDASGIEGEWLSGETLNPATIGLLNFAGEVYLPFLQANADAFDAGKENFSLNLLGHPYTQKTFKYQIKCLSDLRSRYASLPPESKNRADQYLRETGCLEFFTLK
ncbi:MAG: glutathione S-transferase [Sneathiella sp.]|nr:glutathione S-transferase [Sneathiella sp.]